MQLTALGIGAIIGAGIFVATGAAAHNVAGPALMLSYVVAGVTCIFAALCYAEFASMVPVAGSAYTYAYATLGELFAWIIGWDLVLEYAVGSATVANGWSGYFQSVLAKIRDPASRTASAESPWRYDAATGGFVDDRHRSSTCRPCSSSRSSRSILVKGISGERQLQRRHGADQGGGGAVRDRASAPSTSTRPTGTRSRPTAGRGISFFGIHVAGQTDAGGDPVGMLAGAAIIFFAYIGFDSVSTHAEEAKNPQRDVPIGIIASLLDLHRPLHRASSPC